MGAGAGKLSHLADAFQAEAEGCSRALQAIQAWGMSRIQLESDSQLLVLALKNNNEDLSPCSVLIKEIKESLFLNFICHKIELCPGACNGLQIGWMIMVQSLGTLPNLFGQAMPQIL
jgi:hypothetical protein